MADNIHAKFYGRDLKYHLGMEKMRQIHHEVSLNNRNNHLMLLEHSPVITITHSSLENNIKTSKEEILKEEIDICLTDRGGDATFHGPGQLVGYPICKISANSVVDYVRKLEQALLDSCHELNIANACLLSGFTGVWIKKKIHKKIVLEKIIAIGVGLSQGVTKHGFAFNLSIDYQKYQKHIVPCGLKGKGVCSLKEVLLEQGLEMPKYFDILNTVSQNIARVFAMRLTGEF